MITGADKALAQKMMSAIQDKLEAATGEKMEKQAFLKAVCEGIAQAITDHLTQNAQVDPGIPVLAPPPAGTGSTTAPGTIS